jgi:hypothetical protein
VHHFTIRANTEAQSTRRSTKLTTTCCPSCFRLPCADFNGVPYRLLLTPVSPACHPCVTRRSTTSPSGPTAKSTCRNIKLTTTCCLSPIPVRLCLIPSTCFASPATHPCVTPVSLLYHPPQVHNLTIRAKGKVLLENTNLTIAAGRRYGLAGVYHGVDRVMLGWCGPSAVTTMLNTRPPCSR